MNIQEGVLRNTAHDHDYKQAPGLGRGRRTHRENDSFIDLYRAHAAQAFPFPHNGLTYLEGWQITPSTWAGLQECRPRLSWFSSLQTMLHGTTQQIQNTTCTANEIKPERHRSGVGEGLEEAPAKL